MSQSGADDLVTTEDVRDHMRGTLELIAGHECRIVQWTGGREVHYVAGDSKRVMHSCRAQFAPDTCPVCMARKCLGQIDEAESREGGVL